MDRPIPSFYCVYMLRSTVAKLKYFYIGSTPNPRRRLRQHNGEIQGGATRTADAKRRPWEMAVIVTGFPSKIAALQFEWSLQNTHMTRHVRGADKDTLTTGRKRPPATLNKKLQDLHILLRANSFARWPLQVQFFAEDAYKHWQTKTLSQFPYPIPAYTRIVFDRELGTNPPDMGDDADKSTVPAGVTAVDVSYGPILPHVRKSNKLVSQAQTFSCKGCKEVIHNDRDIFAICPNEECHMTAHLTCLTRHFSGVETSSGPLLPVQGSCPTCNHPLSWSNLAKETSLRIRGRAVVESLLKVASTSKTKATQAALDAASARLAEDEDQGSELDEEQDLALAGLIADAQEETKSEKKQKQKSKPMPAAKKSTKQSATVIPDSDTDDIDNHSL